ncbi:MAG TPA: leucyl aminopeptidase, partial [Lachnospiraceae bacterium]|nr:leucyl aminopeptidase [Lachnospiraceae bacterium]
MLCFLYAQLRGAIPLAYEKRWEELTALLELFVEVYTDFTEEELPKPESIRQALYWYCYDYCGEMVERRVREQVDPSLTFATDIVMDADLTDLTYLYRYGEYITENEICTAKFLNAMSAGEIEAMARTYTEGYREGFVHAGIDLAKKRTVNIRYAIGFERVIRAAVRQFAAMGLEPTIFRSAVHVVSKSTNGRVGYVATQANPQYDYDHRMDDALFLDEEFVGRKLRVTQEAYEQAKELARGHAGPACLETFGEKVFVPVPKKECLQYTDAQRMLSARCRNELGQIINRYIPGEERSFTIIAYPVQEIGSQYEEIFAETVKVNNLDSRLYQRIQQCLIDCLDQGVAVRVKGADGNRTDLRVALHPLEDPAKETIFENCVADVNIPVGEVFTSPVLSETNGVLHVKRVYLNGLPYENLELTFVDGRIASYTCTNFSEEEENRAYIRENVLFNHETLPLGEFAIGTNTTAYRMGRTYRIEGLLPILIAEKTGPHFAVGDTCYSWAEDVPVFNPDGKEIIARDNEVSLLRKEDPSKAYLNCHTDITIP